VDPETKAEAFLIPDAAFSLISQPTGIKVDFLLEMDLATVSLKSIRRRLRGYLLRGKKPCPVLFVVPDSKRLNAIAQIAREEAKQLQANATTIWITTKDRISPETVLSTPWVVVGHAKTVSFQGLAEPVDREHAVVFAGNGGQG
jgi:hypothetical protein